MQTIITITYNNVSMQSCIIKYVVILRAKETIIKFTNAGMFISVVTFTCVWTYKAISHDS